MDTNPMIAPTLPSEPNPNGSWERIREAIRRDWEQTKRNHALVAGQELNQSVVDTVKQALGKEVIPPEGEPNGQTWEVAEHPIRFGYDAHVSGPGHRVWSEELASQLAHQWQAGGHPGKWSQVRHWVRQGYEFACRQC